MNFPLNHLYKSINISTSFPSCLSEYHSADTPGFSVCFADISSHHHFLNVGVPSFLFPLFIPLSWRQNPGIAVTFVHSNLCLYRVWRTIWTANWKLVQGGTREVTEASYQSKFLSQNKKGFKRVKEGISEHSEFIKVIVFTWEVRAGDLKELEAVMGSD